MFDHATFETEVIALLHQGQKIQAIKLYKERTGLSLLDAKRAVESLQDRVDATLAGAHDAIVPEAIAPELLAALRMGDTREAVRLFQKRTGAGRREAKRAVAAFARRHGVYDRESAFLTMALLLLVVGAVAALAVGAVWIVVW